MKILEVKTERREIGNIGERLAAKFLKKEGYKILERNYACSGNEIDIIAEDKQHTVFVEVKTRTLGKEDIKEPRPASAVTPEKQRKIISAAKYYLAFHKKEKRIRFDIVEVYLDGKKRKKAEKILHLTSAFDKDSAYSRK